MTEVAADCAVQVAAVAQGTDLFGEPFDLVGAVQVLSAVDPLLLDGGGRVDLIRAWERVSAMAAGSSSGHWPRWPTRPRHRG